MPGYIRTNYRGSSGTNRVTIGNRSQVHSADWNDKTHTWTGFMFLTIAAGSLGAGSASLGDSVANLYVFVADSVAITFISSGAISIADM